METVVGLDFVKPMLQIAKNKSTQSNTDKLTFVLGDALELPFKTNTFDCVTTVSYTHLPLPTIREV